MVQEELYERVTEERYKEIKKERYGPMDGVV